MLNVMFLIYATKRNFVLPIGHLFEAKTPYAYPETNFHFKTLTTTCSLRYDSSRGITSSIFFNVVGKAINQIMEL